MKTSSQIRLEARLLVKRDIVRLFITTTAFIVFTYLLTSFYQMLSGTTEYLNKYMEMLEKAMTTGIMEMEPITWPYVKPASWVVAALCYLMVLLLGWGYRGYALGYSRGREVNFRDVIPPFALMPKIIFIALATAFLTAVGSVFLIIPGLILGYRYSLSIYVLFDHPEMGAIACMRESARLTKGQKMRIFKLEFSFIGWEILNQFIAAMFMVPVLELWVRPYREVSLALLYNEISGYTPEKPIVIEVDIQD